MTNTEIEKLVKAYSRSKRHIGEAVYWIGEVVPQRIIGFGKSPEKGVPCAFIEGCRHIPLDENCNLSDFAKLTPLG